MVDLQSDCFSPESEGLKVMQIFRYVFYVIVCFFVSGCMAPSQTIQHADQFCTEIYEDRLEVVGQISEHIINLEEGRWFWLDDKIGDWTKGFYTSMVNAPGGNTSLAIAGLSGALLGGLLDYNISTAAAKIWEPHNKSRHEIFKTYGENLDKKLYDQKRFVCYEWFMRQTTFSLGSTMWILMGPEAVGKSDYNDITVEDVNNFWSMLATSKTWKFKLRYLGWVKTFRRGHLQYFDLIDLEPVEPIEVSSVVDRVL